MEFSIQLLEDARLFLQQQLQDSPARPGSKPQGQHLRRVRELTQAIKLLKTRVRG